MEIFVGYELSENPAFGNILWISIDDRRSIFRNIFRHRRVVELHSSGQTGKNIKSERPLRRIVVKLDISIFETYRTRSKFGELEDVDRVIFSGSGSGKFAVFDDAAVSSEFPEYIPLELAASRVTLNEQSISDSGNIIDFELAAPRQLDENRSHVAEERIIGRKVVFKAVIHRNKRLIPEEGQAQFPRKNSSSAKENGRPLRTVILDAHNVSLAAEKFSVCRGHSAESIAALDERGGFRSQYQFEFAGIDYDFITFGNGDISGVGGKLLLAPDESITVVFTGTPLYVKSIILKFCSAIL